MNAIFAGTGGWSWRLDRDGQPIFLDPPAEYTPDLPRAKKLLFVLEEIERLDTSPQRHAAAEALLARARLMRRLIRPADRRRLVVGRVLLPL